MQIQISGQHISIGDSLRTHIEGALTKCVNKYFEHATNAHVMLIKEKSHIIKTEILVNQGTSSGTIIKSHGQDDDAYRSFDVALGKAEKQLRKHKSRIKDHKKQPTADVLAFEAKKYVMSPFEDESNGDAPTIIAEKATNVEKMSVSNAVMKLDLLELEVLVFINSGTGRVNVVYYRNDGNIAWIDLPISHQ